MTAVPSTTWLMLNRPMAGKPLPRGMDAYWDTGLGLFSRCTPRLRRYRKQAKRVLKLEEQFADLKDSALKELARNLRETFRRCRERGNDLNMAFAVVREVARRKLGQCPYLVQVIGGLTLEGGCIAEMATGEGKTLTATMPATIAGWRGQGCHVITVNDYLAKRDAEWMEPVYRFCGLRVAYIEQEMSPEERRLAYQADITYCTNKEVTADFLRDRLALGQGTDLAAVLVDKLAGSFRPTIDRLVQRGLNYAIVDEADSILIDEAVTPLIISGSHPNAEQTETFVQAAKVAESLELGSDYYVVPKYKEIKLTDTGRDIIHDFSQSLGSIWSGWHRSEELIIKALTAKEFYHRDRHYIVDKKKVVIVDEFTGRLMPDRQWRDGLHQAVEAKEEIEVTAPKETLARISFQRFYRMYRKLAGMTGTAKEGAGEFWQIYHLPSVVIPTNRPCIRKRLPDIVFTHQSDKWQFIISEIQQIHKCGRPILIGTRSVHTSEHLSQLLTEKHLSHQVLNAVRHREEAHIVANAGELNKITVATNMAGRGTDIKLGPGIAELGGLHVISAEQNESARIDRQLFGRCARQGDPGSAQAILSLEDEFVSRYTKNMTQYLRKRHQSREDNIASRVTRRTFQVSQVRAERLALQQRKAVMKSDHWLDEHLSFAGRE